MAAGKKILIGCLSLVVLALAGVFAFLFWIGAKNNRAVEDGQAFCAGVRVGDSLAAVQDAARRHPAAPLVNGYEDAHEVRFPGFMLFSAACHVTVVDGKVASTRFAADD